ncbi:MAG TPA: serine protease [Candidatus Paceibacterota bacterium]
MLRRAKAALLGLALLFGVGCSSLTQTPVIHVTQDPTEVALAGTAALVDMALVDEDGFEQEPGAVFCSGAFHQDMVLTAAHCTHAVGQTVEVSTQAFESSHMGHFTRAWDYTVVYRDEVQDVAVLFPGGNNQPAHVNLPLAEGEPHYGQHVFTVGHPGGLTYTLTDGIISSPKRVSSDGSIWTQASVPIYFGNSGGPLLTERNEIIGICSFMAFRRSHLGGWDHIDSVRAAIVSALVGISTGMPGPIH